MFLNWLTGKSSVIFVKMTALMMNWTSACVVLQRYARVVKRTGSSILLTGNERLYKRQHSKCSVSGWFQRRCIFINCFQHLFVKQTISGSAISSIALYYTSIYWRLSTNYYFIQGWNCHKIALSWRFSDGKLADFAVNFSCMNDWLPLVPTSLHRILYNWDNLCMDSM
jgi:hypothetical protein